MLRKLASAGTLLVFTLSPLTACVSDDPAEPNGLEEIDCNTTTPPANTRIVRIANFAFSPAEVTVSQGTRVVWINCETSGGPGFSHTSTSDNGVWDSPLLASQGVGKFERTFNQTGNFPYHCTPHPQMQARIVVQ